MTSAKKDHESNSNSSTYDFTHNGERFTVPALSAIPIGALRKSRKGAGPMDQAFILLETVMPEGSPALEAIDTMQPAEFNAWLDGWTQGATVGESVSSES